MMKLYVANIDEISLDRVSEISPQRAEKVKRYKKIADKKRCIGGGLFMSKFLGNAKISANSYGKLIADSGDCFNLSHSGNYVLFALSKSPVGCDIEQIKIVSQNMRRIVFCENELNKIESSQDKIGAFFDLWTKKESLLKCIGEGFHRNAKSIDVSKNTFIENGINYYFKLWHFSDYTISVCSKENDFPKDIEFIKL